MVQSCLNVLKVFKTSSVQCTLHCYLISHLPPKIFLHTYTYYSSLSLFFSLSLTHTHTHTYIDTQIITLNLQPPHLMDQFYTLLRTNLITADILSKNFNVFNNPNFIYIYIYIYICFDDAH
jgi:hypothetical protein